MGPCGSSSRAPHRARLRSRVHRARRRVGPPRRVRDRRRGGTSEAGRGSSRVREPSRVADVAPLREQRLRASRRRERCLERRRSYRRRSPPRSPRRLSTRPIPTTPGSTPCSPSGCLPIAWVATRSSRTPSGSEVLRSPASRRRRAIASRSGGRSGSTRRSFRFSGCAGPEAPLASPGATSGLQFPLRSPSSALLSANDEARHDAPRSRRGGHRRCADRVSPERRRGPRHRDGQPLGGRDDRDPGALRRRGASAPHPRGGRRSSPERVGHAHGQARCDGLRS